MAPPITNPGVIDAGGQFVPDTTTNAESIQVLGQRISGVEKAVSEAIREWREERGELRDAIMSVSKDTTRQVEALRTMVVDGRKPNTTALIAVSGVGLTVILATASLAWFTVSNTLSPVASKADRNAAQIDALLEARLEIREDLARRTERLATIQELLLEGKLKIPQED